MVALGECLVFLLGATRISNDDDCSHSQSQFIFSVPIFCSFHNSNDLDCGLLD